MPTPSVSLRPLLTDQDATAFYELNTRWITEYFTMTPEDERILSDPRRSIIDAGGQVLLASNQAGSIVGVVAVLNTADGVYELSKMTVDSSARGAGIGRLLIQAAIEWATANGGEILFLGTNTRLEAAIRLYEEAGFLRTTIEDLQLTDYYARADILMKRALR